MPNIQATLIAHSSYQIYQAAFSLLASRVPEMKAETREEVSPVMTQIVKRMNELLSSLEEVDTISEAMKALLSIGATSTPKEESSLTAMVAVVIDRHLARTFRGNISPVTTQATGPQDEAKKKM